MRQEEETWLLKKFSVHPSLQPSREQTGSEQRADWTDQELDEEDGPSADLGFEESEKEQEPCTA